MLALPLLLITTDLGEVLHMATLPKSKDGGFNARNAVGGAAATAVKLIDVGEFVALLTMFRFPENEPALSESNVKVMVVLCPELIANGRDGPEMLKPDPV